MTEMQPVLQIDPAVRADGVNLLWVFVAIMLEIFVLPSEDAVQIRTGERGSEAV
jgi:hypothetical protein